VIKLGEMLMILELHRQGFVGVRNRQGDRWRPQDGAQTFNQMNAPHGGKHCRDLTRRQTHKSDSLRGRSLIHSSYGRIDGAL
jgi:hypothetical protein